MKKILFAATLLIGFISLSSFVSAQPHHPVHHPVHHPAHHRPVHHHPAHHVVHHPAHH